MTIHLNGNKTQVFDLAFGAAEKLGKIADAAKQAFIEREDAITAMSTAFACGEHLIMLGPPGTSKTALGDYFSKAMGLRYFKQQGNPDLTREDFYGPISTAALRQDKWDREWSGLAVAEFGFVDEIGKASGQVQNMLLAAMEERQAMIANTIYPMPLHSLMSGSNETIHHNPALWDRFTLRLVVRYITDLNRFATMLRTNLNPPSHQITTEELIAMRYASEHIAMQPAPEIDAKLIQIKTHMDVTYKHSVSDRRWRRSLKIAAGAALLRGSDQLELIDLTSLKWMLWDQVDQAKDIAKYIEEQCNQELRTQREIEELVTELEKDASKLNKQSSSNDQAVVAYRCRELTAKLTKTNSKSMQPLKDRVAKVDQKLIDLMDI